MKKCPDCKTDLQPIKIVDQLGHGGTRVGLAYTRGEEPKTSAWSGKMTNSTGHVHAFICDRCARVLFYAIPS